MERHWQDSIDVTAPAEQVYAYLADFPRHCEWAQTLDRMEQVRAGDDAGIGARYFTYERQAFQADGGPNGPLPEKSFAGKTLWRCGRWSLTGTSPGIRTPCPGWRHPADPDDSHAPAMADAAALLAAGVQDATGGDGGAGGRPMAGEPAQYQADRGAGQDRRRRADSHLAIQLPVVRSDTRNSA